jgi:hypothetical protein
MKSLDDISTKASQKTVQKIANENIVKGNKTNKIKKYGVSCIFCGEIYIQENDKPT